MKDFLEALDAGNQTKPANDAQYNEDVFAKTCSGEPKHKDGAGNGEYRSLHDHESCPFRRSHISGLGLL